MPRGWGSPGTATMIRSVMQASGRPMYVAEIHRAVKTRITGQVISGILLPGINQSREQQGKKPLTPPSYKSIRNMIYDLKRLGLIKFSHDEANPSRPTAFKRRYYILDPARVNHPYWRNPRDALYDPEAFQEKTQWREDQYTPADWMDKIRQKKT